MTKPKPILDWYGNPLPEDKIPQRQEGVKGEVGADGRMYLRPWSADDKPGKRIALEDSYLVIHDAQGRVVYDYGCSPPADARIEPGYVGFLFEEILKSYFGQAHVDKVRLGSRWPKSRKKLWVETTEDGQKYWRWNVIWHDRLPVEDEQNPPFKTRGI